MQEGVTVVRNCDKYRQVCQLMENCGDHGGGEQGLVEV